MSIYQRIKDLSSEKKLSIRELESDLKFSNGTISKWKNDRAPSDKLLQVSKYFNVSTDYLLGKSSNKKSSSNTSEVDLADDDVIMSFEGIPIPPEDLELMRRLLRGKKQ